MRSASAEWHTIQRRRVRRAPYLPEPPLAEWQPNAPYVTTLGGSVSQLDSVDGAHALLQATATELPLNPGGTRLRTGMIGGQWKWFDDVQNVADFGNGKFSRVFMGGVARLQNYGSATIMSVGTNHNRFSLDASHSLSFGRGVGASNVSVSTKMAVGHGLAQKFMIGYDSTTDEVLFCVDPDNGVERIPCVGTDANDISTFVATWGGSLNNFYWYDLKYWNLDDVPIDDIAVLNSMRRLGKKLGF